MSDNFLMGLDIGSSGGRCLLLNTSSNKTVCTKKSWEHIPVESSIGYYDLDTESIKNSLKSCVKQALSVGNIEAKQIVGIAIGSVRYGLVALDKDGKILFAVPNIDGRAAMCGADLAATRGAEFHKSTGHWPGAVFPGVRLKEWASAKPDVFSKIDTFLSIGDWLGFCLSGKKVMEMSHASGTILFDINKNIWCDDLIASLELPRHIFPEVQKAGTQLGILNDEVALEWNLFPGTPVVLGGADTQMAILGSKVTEPEQIIVIGGSTIPVQATVTKSENNPCLWTEHHILPNQYVVESNAGPVGTTLQFIADCLYDSAQSVAMLCAEAKTASIGAGGILSSVGTSIFNAQEIDIPLGNITLAPVIYHPKMAKRSHLARAVLEGIAYGVYANILQIQEMTQQNYETIYVTGGISRGSLWPQILSDISNTRVVVSSISESTALGASICAGVGVGIYKSLKEGATKIVSTNNTYVPDEDRHFTYKSFFEQWLQLYKASKGANKVAAENILQAVSETNLEGEKITESTFRPKIYISAHMDKTSLSQLQKIGDVSYVSYRDEMQLLTGETLVETLQGYHVFISEVDVVDGEALHNLPELKLIFSCRGNAVNIDADACTMLGIPVLNTPGRNATAVADLTVSFMLMLSRKLSSAIQFLHNKDVEAGDMARMGMAHKELQGNELWYKKIGLIGMGAIGKKVIKRLLPFEVEILVYDPYVGEEDIAATGAMSVSLDELLANCDIISLHAAVTDKSRNLISSRELKKMKPGAFLVNTARAALIDEEALIESLRSKHLGGVALDVFSIEPPGADHPLLSFDNVIATPHVAGNTHEVSEHQGSIVVEELMRIQSGQMPRNVLNPSVLKRFNWTQARKKLTAEEIKKLESSTVSVTDLEVEAIKKEETSSDIEKSESQTISTLVKTEKPKEGMFSKLRNIVTNKKDKNTSQEETTMITPTSNTNKIQHLQNIIETFLKYASADNTLKNFSRKKDILVQYVIPDTEQYFSFHYANGDIVTKWGKATKKPDVTLKMKAEILDGVLTGKINGVRAAMTGKLSFSGDTVKAIKLKKTDSDMIRLYTRSRNEIGCPGDLSQFSPSENNQTEKPSVQKSSNEQVASTNITKDERDQVVQIFNELYQAGLITSTGGNVSLRLPNKESEAWITPSQVYKGGLNSSMIVKVDLDGNQLDNHDYNASSERHLHTIIMKHRPEIQAVVHSHAPQATILALSELPFLPISTEAAFVGEIPRVPFIMPGSKELAESVYAAMGKGTAVLMQNHGLVVAAASLRQAADLTMIIEQTAEKIVASYSVGKKPVVIPEETVEMLRGLGEMII